MKLANILGITAAIVISYCSSALAESAVAKISGTDAGSAISGTVNFVETDKGLKVTAKLSGVPAGNHGFHIHEFGSCAGQGKAAGDHYNPAGAKHGKFSANSGKKAHAGDIGNIIADKNGNAELEVTLPNQGLSHAKYNVAGRSIVLHDKSDDLTSQPSGNSGARIGCGIITISAN